MRGRRCGRAHADAARQLFPVNWCANVPDGTDSRGGIVVEGSAPHQTAGLHFLVSTARACGSRFGAPSVKLIERAGDALMPTDGDCHAPTEMPCPNCGSMMRLVAIEPTPSVQGTDEITYHCGSCNHQEKQIRKVEKP
jgi:hypothetical protein